MKFRGKVSWWFYAIMIGVAVLLIPLIVVSAFVEPNCAALLMNLILLVSIEYFSVSIAVHNFVVLEKDDLLHASTMIAVVDKECFLCEMKKRNSAIAIR